MVHTPFENSKSEVTIKEGGSFHIYFVNVYRVRDDQTDFYLKFPFKNNLGQTSDLTNLHT